MVTLAPRHIVIVWRSLSSAVAVFHWDPVAVGG